MAVVSSVEAPTRYRFTVEEYERMGALGVFSEDDRIELIDGEIIQMSAVGHKHAKCVTNLDRDLQRTVGDELIVAVQNPIVIPEHDEPQPDIAILKGTAYDGETNPLPKDVLLVIEVSDTSLPYDQSVKLPLYASAGIPETWIADIAGELVTRHSRPSERGYLATMTFRREDIIQSLVLPDLRLTVSDILP